MTAPIGPGSEMVCIEEAPTLCGLILVRLGQTYTVDQVFPAEVDPLGCHHGADCRADLYTFREIGDMVDRDHGWVGVAFCARCFRPKGGDLQKFLDSATDVEEPTRRVCVPA